MSGLSVIGLYRKKLIEVLHAEEHDSLDVQSMNLVLDDEYIKSMPIDTFLEVTAIGLSGRVIQCIFKVTKFHCLGDSGKIPSVAFGHLYGTDIPVTPPSAKNAHGWSIDSTRIIEYKLLDVSRAPFFINWHWLAASMKRKLFM